MSAEIPLPDELSPSRYIEKVSLITGETLDEEILPKQLLVQHHRDYHLVDIHARHMMSRVVRETGSPDEARRRMREVRRKGKKAADVIAKLIGQPDSTRVSKALFGLKEKEYFFRFKKSPMMEEEIDRRLAELRQQAAAQLDSISGDGGMTLRVLLTGGTGFVGKEIIWQAAHDDEIAEMIVVIRPRKIVDRKTGEVVRTLSPAERGETLLDRLWLDDPSVRSKFMFVEGDVEQPDLGIDSQRLEELGPRITHVIHCAASVAFDDPYEKSFRTNVTGTLNALRFSLALQSLPGSAFVSHSSIETSYIHGRKVTGLAREAQVVFPRNFYNNYYEATKAMASFETERFMLEKGLRVVQLCPAIVIGETKAGNNRGDSKVVNAPVNLFGRAQEALTSQEGSWMDRSKGAMLAKMACVFPADPTAELNLVPVDRVVAGILAALKKPAAVGERIHLAGDHRLTSHQIAQIVQEELGVKVKLAEPTLHRTVTLPIVTKVLKTAKQDKIAHALDKLGTIFAGYSEWGQPIHQVGNDVRVLGLSTPRPNTEHVFRLLCRHNRFVQEFGKIRDLDEISRREKAWWDFMLGLEDETGMPVGAIPADKFHTMMADRLDTKTFIPLGRDDA
jgi:nucleoside-diphosphate-sugar epimerase